MYSNLSKHTWLLLLLHIVQLRVITGCKVGMSDLSYRRDKIETDHCVFLGACVMSAYHCVSSQYGMLPVLLVTCVVIAN